jgi:hypothetical protein
MRIPRFFLAMILLVVPGQGSGFASQSNQIPEQGSSQSGGKPVGETQANEGKAASAGNESSVEANQNRQTAKKISAVKRLSLLGQPKSASTRAHSVKPAENSGIAASTPADVMTLHQSSGGPLAGVSGRRSASHNPPVPSTSVSVGGGQFKRSRVASARLVTTGGPANSTRGTAAINGSDMKRKP